MSRCNWCAGKGLIFLRYQGESGYSIASCHCRDGQWYRQKGLLRAWAAKQHPKPDAIGRLEEFFPDLSDMVALRARTEVEAEREVAGGSTQTKAS